jgi:hypothetical protein
MAPFDDFFGVYIKIYRMEPGHTNFTYADEGTEYTREQMWKIKPKSNDKPFSWAVNFITGYEYHIHWL